MESQRFDEPTRLLANSASRRRVLKGFAVSLFGGAIGVGGARSAAAATACASARDCPTRLCFDGFFSGDDCCSPNLCCDGVCTNTTFNTEHCEACNNACAVDEACRFDGCCGASGAACQAHADCCSGCIEGFCA